MISSPVLLLADEPTGNLDTASGEAVLTVLRELHESGTTVVIVTHNHELAMALERRIEMRDGRIIADSAPGSLVVSPIVSGAADS